MLTLAQTRLDPRVPHVRLLPVEPQPVLGEIPAGGRRRGGLELWGHREGAQHPQMAEGLILNLILVLMLTHLVLVQRHAQGGVDGQDEVGVTLAPCKRAWHGTAWNGMEWLDGTDGHSMACYSMAWHSLEWHCTAWNGMAQPGIARQAGTQRSTACVTWPGTVSPGPAQADAAHPAQLGIRAPRAPRAGAKPAPARVARYSQYLMTAMFTGAVQVAMASPRSAAIAAAAAGRPQGPPPRHARDCGVRRVPPRHWSRGQQPAPNSQW